MPGITVLPSLADPDIVSTAASFSLTLASRFQQHITATGAGVVVTVPARRSHRIVNQGSISFEVDIVGPSNLTVDPNTTLLISWDVQSASHTFERIGGGGTGTFVGLTDTPGTYTGQAGQMFVVNGTEDAVEFVTPVTSLPDLSDVSGTVTSPADGDILVFRNATNEFVLEAKPAAGSNPALNDITDVNITAVVDQQVLTYDQGTGTWINAFVPRTFSGLGDTPGTYSGQANQIVAVNSGETGLEFIPQPTGYVHPNHSGDVVSVGDTTQTIQPNVVTFAKMQDIATQTFIGRNTAATGDPEELDPATARAILNVADGATSVTELADLSDVNASVSTPTDGDILVYRDAQGNFILEPKPAGGGNPALGDLTDVTITAVQQGQGITWNSTSSQWENTTLVTNFLQLTDSPAGYVNQAGKLAAVNGTETGLEFVDGYSHPNHTGDVTSVGDGVTTISPGVVTNPKLADMAAWTIKARNAATTGDPQDITIGSLAPDVSPGAGYLTMVQNPSGELVSVDIGNYPTGGRR